MRTAIQRNGHSRSAKTVNLKRGNSRNPDEKNEDENCTSSFPSSTIPLTSGIEEAPQLLLSVIHFYHACISKSKCLESD